MIQYSELKTKVSESKEFTVLEKIAIVEMLSVLSFYGSKRLMDMSHETMYKLISASSDEVAVSNECLLLDLVYHAGKTVFYAELEEPKRNSEKMQVAFAKAAEEYSKL